MKIEMTKRKPGFYAQWYNIIGINSKNKICNFLIYSEQANSYPKAIKFWNKTWGNNEYTPLVLRNSEPMSVPPRYA